VAIEQLGVIQGALQRVGYSEFARDFSFGLGGTRALSEDRAPLVAFWSPQRDQFSSAVAVGWSHAQSAVRSLDSMSKALWAPYAILTDASNVALWESFSSETGRPQPYRLISELPLAELPSRVSEWAPLIEPSVVQSLKQKWRQAALYEASGEPNAFFDWAYKPNRDYLARLLTRCVRDALDELQQETLSEIQLRWFVRLVALRISWDKRWTDPGDRNSSASLLEGASRYPTQIDLPPSRHDLEILADVISGHFQSVSLATADGALLSVLLTGAFLSKETQRATTLYPTPPDIAWRILSGLPIELLSRSERLVFDGTAGTGTFLVAALERLKALAPDLAGRELRSYLTGMIRGNDNVPAMADVSRVALDLSLGAVAGDEWSFSTDDVVGAIRKLNTPATPKILVGNLPFQSSGRTPDVAIRILDAYLDLLPRDGLLGVVVPGGLLSSNAGVALRRRLLERIELLEVTQLLPGAFSNANFEAVAWLGYAKTREDSGAQHFTTWRRLSPDRRHEHVEVVPQDSWLASPRCSMTPALADRIAASLTVEGTLEKILPPPQRTQGIVVGANARRAGAISREPSAGGLPYLDKARSLGPFQIDRVEGRAWIVCQLQDLQWPRMSYLRLFAQPKVLVRRIPYSDQAWRSVAALDTSGLLPSDNFVAFAPHLPGSPEFLVGLLNSSLINCLLSLRNQGFTIRMDEILNLPFPRDRTKIVEIEGLVRDLEKWRDLPPEDRESLVMRLDEAVFDSYQAPVDTRRAVSDYFQWYSVRRPGFDRNIVAAYPEQKVPDPSITAARAEELLERQEEGLLSDDDAIELESILDSWQHQYSAWASDQLSRGAVD